MLPPIPLVAPPGKPGVMLPPAFGTPVPGVIELVEPGTPVPGSTVPGGHGC
ncbi:MAG TPA: hypothetical protein VGT40_07370 [Methylomirabilota bacterium]|nr:hypothetical protein [Methylomirabilota bacterium]